MADDAMDARLEQALLGMQAKHAHDFDAPENGPAAQGGNELHDFDVNEFLHGLDAIFDAHNAAEKAGPYLEQAAVDAENAGDEAGLLTVLNETMGFYRSQGRHKENQWIVQRALELALHMGLEGTESWATTLINCATAMRAAKRYDQAEDLYHQALDCANKNFAPNDRRLAALHNNLSMLYSETNRLPQAEIELRQALHIVEAASVNPDADIDVASSNTNLALVLLQESKLKEAHIHATKALTIYETGKLTHSAHYASALAGCAQVLYVEHRYGEAASHYRSALAVIAECYGKDTDYYRVTEANLREAEAQIGNDDVHAANSADATSTETNTNTDATAEIAVSGLKLARAFWTQVGKPMITAQYPQYVGRIAAGLVGHGSECYGFDDAYSQDHDFGPRFCLWLTDDDYEAIGEQLEADYEALPRGFTMDAQGRVTFIDIPFSPTTPRAQGANRRDGVFRISKTRQGFKDMPDDVRLALISKRLGMIAQAGQYNLPRSLKRGDGAAAWLSIHEFVQATASLVFLVNVPMVVGYMPYYKWQFAALRKLSGSMFALLPNVGEQLETVMRLSSAACYGGAGFGEGGKGAATAIEKINDIVEQIAADIVKELKREHLTTSGETFLEWQRPYVEDHIVSDDPVLKSL